MEVILLCLLKDSQVLAFDMYSKMDDEGLRQQMKIIHLLYNIKLNSDICQNRVLLFPTRYFFCICVAHIQKF